jgi:hypothetical protein
MDPSQKDVYLDNPLELEKVPKTPLTFEFVAQAEPVPVWGPMFQASATATVALGLVMFFRVWIESLLGPSAMFLPMVTTILTKALIAWSLARPKIGKYVPPELALCLAILTLLLASIGQPNGKLLTLITGALLFYATGEFAIHWSHVRRREMDPFALETRETEEAEQDLSPKNLDYSELMVPVGLGAFCFVNVVVIPGGFLIALIVTGAIWVWASEKCRRREARIVPLVRCFVERSCAYPDMATAVPGLMRSPMLPRSLRIFPIALFFSSLCGLAWNPIMPAFVSPVDGAQQLAQNLTFVAGQIVLGIGVLFVSWVSVSVELTNED